MASVDINLISMYLFSRNNHDKFSGTMPKHLLETETQMIVEDISHWYKDHGMSLGDIAPNNLQAFWTYFKMVRHISMAHAKLQVYRAIIAKAVQGPAILQGGEIAKNLILRDHAGGMATKCDRYSAGDTSFNLYEELLDDIESAKVQAGIHDGHGYEVQTPFESIVADIGNLSTGLNWRSPCLEMALGPIRKGNFIIIAGFVDSGKSTLLASEITFMATQLPDDKKVILFNNEEAGSIVKLRLVQAATGMSFEDIQKDAAQAWAQYTDIMNGDANKIVLVDSSMITLGLIKRKLRQYDAGLIAFDQLSKVRGFKVHGDDKLGQLRDIFEYARGLAKDYAPVLALHQARGDANGVQYIEMHQLAGSQSAVQGEADAIVTIGRDLAMDNIRFLYVPKNKLPTPADPKQRHGKFQVTPDFARARFDQ